ncbi:MAG: Transcriptional regulator, MarR family [Pedosphaera sp.]|nr:Transcriptional regulator, MarR family [Pedosphaera sp.]
MSSECSSETRRKRLAFLLSQVGAHAAAKFAERLGPLKLAPAHAGILWAISADTGISQQGLAKLLGMFPSRLVLVLDELEQMGLIERKATAADRRTYALHVTAKGRTTMQSIGRLAQEHQEKLCAALTPGEQETLAALLSRIAEEQGLAPGVHPGYRQIGRGKKGSC